MGPVRRSHGPALHSSGPEQTSASLHSDKEDHAVFNLRLQLERPCAESTAGSTARPGEQLVISVATRENRASSPGRPFCPVQDPWEQALVHELGTVFDSRVPVHRATEHPRQGSTCVLVTTGSGSSQASNSLRAQEPRRSICTVCQSARPTACPIGAAI